jgi:hypothetical protein
MLHKLSELFPSKKEMYALLVVCSLPSHVWGMIQFLYRVPSYILDLKMAEILGVFSYNQVFILLEGLAVTAVLLAVSILLPYRLLRKHLLTRGTLFALITAIWFVLFNFHRDIVKALLPGWGRLLRFLGSTFEISIAWNEYYMLVYMFVSLWVASLPIAIHVSFRLASGKPKFGSWVQKLPDRLSVLFILFFLLDLVSIIIVFARNIL